MEISKNLHNESQHIQGRWIVEAVFSEQNDPSSGMYSTIDVCTSKDDADNLASRLCDNYGHEFITYRARPFGIFRDFVDFKPSSTIYKSDDEKMNKAYEMRIIKDHERRQHESKKQEASLLHDKYSETIGTVQNFCKSLYNCYLISIRLQKLSDDITNSKLSYDKSFNQMCESYFMDNTIMEKWEPYLDHNLKYYNDTFTLPALKDWFTINKVNIIKYQQLDNNNFLPIP